MDQDKNLAPDIDPEDIDADQDEAPAGKSRRNQDVSAANRERKRRQRMREAAERFDREDSLAHDIQAAQEELLALGCRPSEFIGSGSKTYPYLIKTGHYELDLMWRIIRGVGCGFYSIQNSSSDHHGGDVLVTLDGSKEVRSLDDLEAKKVPILPFVDAAANAIISWSRQFDIPKYGPTDKLINRALILACDFFDREPKNLDDEYVARAREELHLYSLSRQRISSEYQKLPFRPNFVPDEPPKKPEPEPEAVATQAIVTTEKDAAGNDIEKILSDVNQFLSGQRVMTDAEILKTIQLQLPPLGSEPQQ